LNDPKYIAPEFRARIVNPEVQCSAADECRYLLLLGVDMHEYLRQQQVMDEPSQHFHPEEEGNVVNSSTVLGAW